MLITPTLTVDLDTQEPRVQTPEMAVLADGRYWDTLGSTAYIDPVTRTAMLMPLYKTDLWKTAACGRLGKSDCIFQGSPDHWIEYAWQYPGVEKWLKALGVNEGVTTAASWPKNQPFYLGWFAFGTGGDEFIQMECGWSDGSLSSLGPNTPDIRLKFWSNGKCEIFKNGAFIGEGNIFERKVTSQNAYATETTSSKADSKQLANSVVEVLLIPYRRRELLIVSNTGGGFNFVFEDIDPNDTDPTITGAGPFFWYVPSGQATAQVAPMNTLTTGSALSLLNGFLDIPQSGQTSLTNATWDAPGFGSVNVTAALRNADNTGAFVATGSNRYCRLRADLTGDGAATPFVYGAQGVYPAIVQNTDDTETTTLDDFIKSVSLSVPDSPTDALLTLNMKSPDAVEAAGAAKITRIGNRPIEASLGTIAFLTGRTKMPAWGEGINDTARDLTLEARDRCMALENHRIRSPIPLDGVNLSAALAYFAKMPGYSDSDMDIQAIDYALPTSGQSSEGQYALIPEEEDTPLQWIQKLWEGFAKNFFWGWVPRVAGPKFRFHDLDYLNAQAVATTLYETTDQALDAGIDRRVLPQHVFRSYRESPPFIEANEIWVVGRNPKTGKPLRTHYLDTASANPTLKPSLRPDNWVGERWPVSYGNSSLTTLADGARSCEQLARRLTPVRIHAEWTSDFLLWSNGQPVWRGDLVKVKNKGIFRVVSLFGDLKSEHAQEDDDDFPDQIWRPFTYVGEKVRPDPPTP